MANSKISALTSATTPLAGTEVLPIVQSGVTKQVSVANLTAGRAVNSAGGTFTDNFVQGTAGKGVNFTANTNAPGMTSELLAWYEEGTFTPVVVYSGTNTPVYFSQVGRYTRIGRIVNTQIYVSWNESGSTGNVILGGLPFTSVTSTARAIPSVFSFGFTGLPVNLSLTGFVNSNATTIYLALNDNAATALSATYTDNDQDLYLTVSYEVA